MVESKIIKIGVDQVICSTTLFVIKNIDLQLNVFLSVETISRKRISPKNSKLVKISNDTYHQSSIFTYKLDLEVAKQNTSLCSLDLE